MPKTKVALTLEASLVSRVDDHVRRGQFRSRSQAIEAAVVEQLARMARRRLAEECAKLDASEERRTAEEGLGADAWPEY